MSRCIDLKIAPFVLELENTSKVIPHLTYLIKIECTFICLSLNEGKQLVLGGLIGPAFLVPKQNSPQNFENGSVAVRKVIIDLLVGNFLQEFPSVR